MDIANIQTLMSTPIKVALTLADILKVKPKLWKQVKMCVGKVSVPMPNWKPIQMTKEMVKQGKRKPIPINKLGD